jgi:tRNA A-37 threonylcarbamoyl transferase component Bud32
VPLHLTGAPDEPGLLDLPWQLALESWPEAWLVGLPRGLSRHVVRFVRIDDAVYAVKEIDRRVAEREYRLLRAMERAGVPAVQAVGIVDGRESAIGERLESALVTRHLQFSLPYRALYSQTLRPDTAVRLLDALAVLLVRLHLAGFYWGDCSLSNTLFRRDAGAFAAYLVDAETAEQHAQPTEGQRSYDIDMARTNIIGELMDLQAGDLLDDSVDPLQIGDTIVCRYRDLWSALTDPEVFRRGEQHRLDARIRRLNELGFDVAELEVQTGLEEDQVLVQPKVVDAGHHARRLLRLAGLDAEENQARRLLNDLDSYRAATGQQDEPEELVAHTWVTEVFLPVVRAVPRQLRGKLENAEVFHEVLEHRWFLSEREGRDVGIHQAVRSYVGQVLPLKPDERSVLAEIPRGARPSPTG